MNYLKKIFGISISENIQIHYPKWDFKVLLLKRLSRASPQDVFAGNKFVQGKYEEILDVNKEIQNFIRNGYISISDYKENLQNEFTVKELQEIIKTKSLKISGRKIELVERVFQNFDQEEILNPKANLKKYVLTEKGKNIIKEDKQRFNKELEYFQNEVFKLLYNFKFEEAFKSVSDFYALYPFPLGMNTDWKRGFAPISKEQTKQLRNIDLDFCQYNFKADVLNLIRTELATYSLFQLNYFGKYEVEQRLLNIDSQFECALVNSFLKDSPTGVFRNYNPSNNINKLEIFVHYCINIVYNKATLKKLLELRDNEYVQGITLVSNKVNCKYCENTTDENYFWKQLNEIPFIPKYPGCLCYYVMWREK
ncbi:SAP domain-containing protein [Zunongwangia profunda]|uniref:SAP domain-containing protein n=1 Tax=Zunongwangia profunda TaxID=398743 RepID=UPI001D1869CC|nr:SAP domain-containing protein [Zunongwangia profunda]MCC4230031.1 SAP domain-containing protein [Zunongwangia profunda]